MARFMNINKGKSTSNGTMKLIVYATEQIISEFSYSYIDLMKAYPVGIVRLLKAIACENLPPNSRANCSGFVRDLLRVCAQSLSDLCAKAMKIVREFGNNCS